MKYSMIALLMSLVLLTGCATMFGDSTQSINLVSKTPVEIEIIDGSGSNTVQAPGSFAVVKGTEQVSYRVKGECYRDNEKKLPRTVAGSFWLNILSAGVFGSGVDYLTGKMWNYQSTINANNLKKSNC